MFTSVRVSLEHIITTVQANYMIILMQSLFGMNVDILEKNPDWRWYLLFSGGCLTLTVLVWLLFKYSEVCG